MQASRALIVSDATEQYWVIAFANRIEAAALSSRAFSRNALSVFGAAHPVAMRMSIIMANFAVRDRDGRLVR